MVRYPINKGIDRPVEFKGLKAQHLFLLTGGLFAASILFTTPHMVGAGQWLCIGLGIVSASAVVWLTFRLDAKYGEHGLMKLDVIRMCLHHVLYHRRMPRPSRQKRRKGRNV